VGSSSGFYRSSNGVIGGVCAGIAEHYGIDALPVRLVAALLLIASLGLIVFVYLILYLKWPLRSNDGSMFEVKPHTVDSTAYGELSYETIDHMGVGRRLRADAPLSVGHIPPLPPREFVARYGTTTAPYFRYLSQVQKEGTMPASDAQASSAIPADSGTAHFDRSVVFLVLVAVFALTVFFDYLLTKNSPQLKSMSCLPLFFLLLGISMIAIPNRFFSTFGRLVNGVGLIVLGLFATAVSVGVLSASLLQNPWVVVTLGVSAITGIVSLLRPRRSTFAALLCLIVLFSALAFGIFAEPGQLDWLAIDITGSGTTVLDVNPWR
jgi:phage shock protein C